MGASVDVGVEGRGALISELQSLAIEVEDFEWFGKLERRNFQK